MRLDARVKRLEDAQGAVAQDLIGYDDPAILRDHRMYFCEADGSDVLLVAGLTEDRFDFPTEQELWDSYPAGTKFYRAVKSGGSYSVTDGVMRELHFPPVEMSPELQAVIDDILADLSVDLAK